MVGAHGGITGTVLPLVVLSCDEPRGCRIPSRAALGRDLNFSFQFHVPFPNRGPGAASYHLGWCSADKGALETLGECSFSMRMYIGAESAAKVNTTLPFPKMSSRNCKGSWSKNSVSDPFCFLLGEVHKLAPSRAEQRQRESGFLWHAPKVLGAGATTRTRAGLTQENNPSKELYSHRGMWNLHQAGRALQS